jgi:hypothetical protein
MTSLQSSWSAAASIPFLENDDAKPMFEAAHEKTHKDTDNFLARTY